MSADERPPAGGEAAAPEESATPRCVLVTGATAGFGETMTRLFVREGMRVIATGRRADRLEALRASCGGLVHALVFDVGDREATVAALASLPAPFAAIDALVNNAGLALGTAPAQDASPEDWRRMIATNVAGVVHCTEAVLPGMRARGRGHVVAMASTAGAFPYPGGNVYGASKAAITAYAMALSRAPENARLRFTNVEPGMVGGTEFSSVRYRGDAAKAGAVYANTTALTPDDVADAVLFALARPHGSNVRHLQLMPITQAPGPLLVDRTA